MFVVRDKNDVDKTLKVYATSYDPQYYNTMFLVFQNGEWSWVRTGNYFPADV
jgi:hypothetical protein